MTKQKIKNLIDRKARKYGIDKDFFDAVIRVESNYNPSAYNSVSGALGLGQVMPVVVGEYEDLTGNEVSDIMDPEMNLEVSAWYLGERIPGMLRTYGQKVTTRNLIWSYNAGIGKMVSGVLPQETKNYFQKIDKTYPFLEYYTARKPVKKKPVNIDYARDLPVYRLGNFQKERLT